VDIINIFTSVVAVILILLPISDWTATFILQNAAKKNNNIALKERRNVAAILAIAVSLNAVLGAVRVTESHIHPFLAILILSTSLILVSVPNLYWLSLFIRDKLRGRANVEFFEEEK
jgi:putative Mn2+ efflux pump MntP